ncbi:MAG TPA: hypothetical protein VNP72_04795 [Longimicrobium sp.]|nr:hypothetical protein [Longimicrobium sp.]
MYYYELQHRDSITENISWSLPVLAALGGAILYLMKEVPDYPSPMLGSIHLIAATASLICWVGAAMSMAQAWWGVEYGYLTTPAKIERWFAELEEREMRYPGSEPAEKLFQDRLVAALCEATESNRLANRRKSWKHHMSKRWLAAAVLPLVVGLFLSYLSTAGESSLKEGDADEQRAHDSATAATAAAGGVLPGGQQASPAAAAGSQAIIERPGQHDAARP